MGALYYLSRVTQKGPLAYFWSIFKFWYFLNVYDVKIYKWKFEYISC